MAAYEKSMRVLSDLFGRDCTFALATAKDNIPSLRVVDTYYEDGVFWVVTYAKSVKVQAIESNPAVAWCHDFQNFRGKAYNAGHPLREENKAIRETLTRVFEP